MKWIAALALAAALGAAVGAAQQRPAPTQAPPPLSTWTRGLPADPGYFPIAVWLQSPSNAAAYKAAGINLYVALWEGPTAEQLAQLKAAGMPVIVGQSRKSLAFVDDRTIVGWMHGDEPDNAQEVVDPATGKKGYGPFIAPEKIVNEYEQMRAADPTRPVMLNLGQGVANDAWVGRGSGAKLDDYRTYVKGCDIVSFDVYPVASDLKPIGDDLGYVSKGLDRLAEWTGGTKRIWNCIECTRIDGGSKATPEQVRAETWLALVHGSRGIIYFVHQFKPKFDEHALLDDPDMLRTVTETNRRIEQLAPVLNSPTLDGASAKSDSEQAPIDVAVRQYRAATYLFAVNAHPTAAKAELECKPAASARSAEVIGESRQLPAAGGRFEDRFEPYAVHIYRLR
jgi:hypothetical protein